MISHISIEKHQECNKFVVVSRSEDIYIFMVLSILIIQLKLEHIDVEEIYKKKG